MYATNICMYAYTHNSNLSYLWYDALLFGCRSIIFSLIKRERKKERWSDLYQLD